ncbi:cyclase family protein [Arthrobacter sp. D2-10]
MKAVKNIFELAHELTGHNIYDVSPVLGPDTPMFLVHPAPEVRPDARYEPEKAHSASNVLVMSEHSGSHVDAPLHFDQAGKTMAQVDVDALFLKPYKKYDFSHLQPEPGQLVTLEELRECEQREGFDLEPGDIAILEYGWDQYRPGMAAGKPEGWWGSNEPGITAEACSYLADRGITAVASDTAGAECSTKDGQILTLPGHDTYFLPRGILIIEGLEGLGQAPAQGLFAALPLKIADGTGSPIRVVLIA